MFGDKMRGSSSKTDFIVPERVLKLFLAYRPDRWDNLPDAAKALPGLYSNLMTFSVGPRVSGIVILLPCPPLIPQPRSLVLG